MYGNGDEDNGKGQVDEGKCIDHFKKNEDQHMNAKGKDGEGVMNSK